MRLDQVKHPTGEPDAVRRFHQFFMTYRLNL
jgi:hypothetical protein